MTPYITHGGDKKQSKIDYETEYDTEVKRPSKYAIQRIKADVEEQQQPERLENKGFPEHVPQYYSKFTATPYERFSFKPSKGLGSSVFSRNLPAFNPSYSSRFPKQRLASFEYQPSENIPINVKSGCVKVNKIVRTDSGNIKDKLMECSICRDPNTGEKTQRCSYEAAPEPQSHYQATSHKYGKPEAGRSKRQDSDAFEDPYEEIKTKAHKYYSKPADFEKEYYQAPDFSKIAEEYKFDPKEYEGVKYQDEGNGKSFSELQSEKLVQEGEHCKKVKKGGSTCLVCTDPNGGGNYEQCAYESEPKEKKFAYSRQSRFDGDKDTESTDLEPTVKKQRLRKKPKDAVYIDDVEKVDDYEASRKSKPKKVSSPKRRGSKKFDDHFHSEFPEFNNQESKRQETKTFYDYFKDGDEKAGDDVHKVLAEFGKKDRSKCKQVVKNGLTCYLCLDKKGVQHEECMFVSQSRPKNEHSAYHKLERLKLPRHNSENGSESMVQPVKVPPSTSTTSTTEKSSPTTKRVESTSNRSRRNASELDKEVAESESKIDVRDTSGYFSEETKPVFSKDLGATLPRYMVEKSEFERDYDKTVARGV